MVAGDQRSARMAWEMVLGKQKMGVNMESREPAEMT